MYTADTAAPTQPAAALPSATDLGVSERKLELWREHGGGDLEPVLASGAVAVLDAQWVISHAEAGGVLNHRQALPKEAFLSFADLVEATTEYDLPVAALSYPWLTKDHPDPRGANLARVARALKALLSDPDLIPRLGIFWDLRRLHPHPDPAPSNQLASTPRQHRLTLPRAAPELRPEDLEFSLPPGPRLGARVVHLEGVTHGYVVQVRLRLKRVEAEMVPREVLEFLMAHNPVWYADVHAPTYATVHGSRAMQTVLAKREA